jgi:hypothetical protein
MGTTSRLAASAVVLGGGLLFAAPVSAQTAPTPCAYPFIDCPTTPAPSTSTPPDDSDTPPTSGTSDSGEGGGTSDSGEGGGTAVDNRSDLPFTGGEIALLAAVGTAALGGGVGLLVAGRRRSA